jgi:hypothetical protein
MNGYLAKGDDLAKGDRAKGDQQTDIIIHFSLFTNNYLIFST